MEKQNKIPFKEKLESAKLALKWTYNASKPLTLTILIVTILGGLLVIVEPYIFKIIIDKITDTSQINLTTKLGIGILGILIIYGVTKITTGILWEIQMLIKKIHGQKLDKYASSQMMDKVSSLDAVYFENPEYYNTLQKASQNMWRINDFFWQFSFFLGQFVSVIVIIITLLTFNIWVVIFISMSVIPSIILIFKKTKIAWAIFDSYSPLQRKANYYKGLMMESPDAVKEIRLFSLKKHFLTKYDSLTKEFITKQEKSAKKELGLHILIAIIEGAFSVLAAWLVIKVFLQNQITIGQVTFYWTLLFQFSNQAAYMIRQIGFLNENSTFISPFVKVLKFKPVIKEQDNPRIFPLKLQKGIEFKNVTFYYPGSTTPALKNVNLIIKPGESIALVGENGSGKTTLIKLLTRLYDVNEGQIIIDRVNIKEYSLQSLYENIGVIFQDFMKYEALVQENIGYGKLKKLSEKEEVHKASVKAEAWEFIKDLEKKYKTHIGKTLVEKGTELSIGQWQKIALSRAFFKDAQILILDEPTASVDAKAEYNLFQKFENLTKNKTTLLISHRFSTVRMAQKIIVIDKGKIIEQGTHQELLSKNSMYAKLFKLQAKGYQ